MKRASSRPVVRHGCDVLVIGSGVSGYCAAIQAGRLGCRTILVEKDGVLGGNSGPDLGVGITGADRYNAFATETGIVHEIHEEAAWIQAFTQIARGTMPYNISRRFEAVVQEFLEKAGVKVLKRHCAVEPTLSQDGRIASVICEDVAAFQRVQIDVEGVVIEASGDGEIGALAGADFDVGSEAQGEFGERSAPAVRTKHVQGTSLVAIAHRTDREVVFVPPPDTPPFVPRAWQGRIGSFVHHHSGFFNDRRDIVFLYVTETGGHMDTIRDDAAIHEKLLRQLWAEWDHIKNGPHREEARCWDLLWVSPKAGKRESRRFLGDVILTQTDLEAGRRFPDDIAWGGHDLDDHQPIGEGANIYAHSVPPLYGIPLRACYSRNVPNLLTAGRLISATHLAHSSSRVMRTGGAIGQGVGYAAALCCRYRCGPREVYERRLDELIRGLLETDGAILLNTLQMPDVPEVTATSELRFSDGEPAQLVPLIADAGVVLWDWRPSLETVECYLRNRAGVAQPLRLKVWRARRDRKWKTYDEYSAHERNDLRIEAFAEIGSLSAELPASHEGWFAFRFSRPLEIGEKDGTSDDDRVLLSLDQQSNVELALSRRPCEIAEMVERPAGSERWSRLGVMAALRLAPAPALGEAANAVNGFKQRFSRGPTHMWMSDPAQGLPQDLFLAWRSAKKINEVHLFFDNLTARRHDYPWECGSRVLPGLVKAYELAYWDGHAWRDLAKEDGNHHRFRRHSFCDVTAARLRLRVLAAHGAPVARVYQVRVV